MPTPTLKEDALFSEAFYAACSAPGGLEKYAESAIQDYTRLKLREDGVFRRFMPPLTVSNSDLVRQADTALPACVIDMEVDSPAAISVPFGTWPSQWRIRPNRYRVLFQRILSPWFAADVEELRTNTMDIRQVISDNSIKDMLAEEDGTAFGAINTILGGSAGSIVPFSGIAQWQTISGSIGTRNAFNDALAIMPQTDGHLVPTTGVINNITVYELQKMGRDEMGGDVSEDILRNGWSMKGVFNLPNLFITNKFNLVPTGSMYLFADPKYLGKFLELEATQMYIKTEAFWISWFAYGCMGATFANPYGFVRADFAA